MPERLYGVGSSETCLELRSDRPPESPKMGETGAGKMFLCKPGWIFPRATSEGFFFVHLQLGPRCLPWSGAGAVLERCRGGAGALRSNRESEFSEGNITFWTWEAALPWPGQVQLKLWPKGPACLLLCLQTKHLLGLQTNHW